MTDKERIEFHEQMLRSIESNLSEATAEIAKLGRTQAEFEERQAVFDQRQAMFDERMARIVDVLGEVVQTQGLFNSGLISLAAKVEALTEQHRQLVETVERYIRFRGDGRETS